MSIERMEREVEQILHRINLAKQSGRYFRDLHLAVSPRFRLELLEYLEIT